MLVPPPPVRPAVAVVYRPTASFPVITYRHAGARGLGAFGSLLTPEQIYGYARGAGFPPATAVKMVAIALRESAGDPSAYNGTPPDDSYGLTQFNMYGSLGPVRRAALGLTSNSQLFDPATNMRAAAWLWAGDDANLAVHWAVADGGTNQARYEANLPAGMNAAIAYGEGGGGAVDPAAVLAGGGDAAGGGVSPGLLAAGVGFGVLLLGLALD